MRCFLAVLLILLASCRHQPKVYALARQERTMILTPPVSKPEIKNVRSHPVQKKGCDVESSSFSLSWRGNTARVSMKPEAFYAPAAAPPDQPGTPGINIAESGPRIYVDSLTQLQNFRDALEAKEDAGCLRAEEANHLRLAMTEAFSLSPQIATYLRFGAYTKTSYFDLTQEFVIRLVTTTAGNPEASFYTLQRAPGDDRLRFILESGSGRGFQAPEKPAYYRYFYRTGAAVHNFPATIIGTPDQDALKEATSQFLADPGQYCGHPASAVSCDAMSVGVNAGFYVSVNSRKVFSRLGGGLYELLAETREGVFEIGRPRTTPKVQTVRRMFHGKLIPIQFDPEGNEILSLILMPGDEITL